MKKESTPISFAELAGNLSRLLDRVVREKETLVVARRGGAVAIQPMRSSRAARSSRRAKNNADNAAFVSAAGSWKAEDTDRLIENIYTSRKRSSRPLVEL